MKRLLSVIVIMLMALSFSACGLSNTPPNDMDNESTSASASESGDSTLEFIPLVTYVEVSLIDITGEKVIISVKESDWDIKSNASIDGWRYDLTSSNVEIGGKQHEIMITLEFTTDHKEYEVLQLQIDGEKYPV